MRHMVMRNRHSGAEPSGWWDDLPPKVRDRFGKRPVTPPIAPHPRPQSESNEPQPRNSRPRLALLRELTLLSLVLFGIAIANIVFLLLALSYLNPGHSSLADPSW